MRDPNFAGTVVLLWHYADDGAMGVVINRSMAIAIGEVGRQLSIEEGDIAMPELPDRVLWGGPVEPGAGFLLFKGEIPEEEGWNVENKIAVTTSQERLEHLLRSGGEYRLCLGYAGWAPGQLDHEIEIGSWLYTEPKAAIVFDEEIDDRYDLALASLGLLASEVWMTPIDE